MPTILKSVLLIDDALADNFLHERVCKKSGLVEEVTAVDGGQAALDALRAGASPEVIFLDINMPGMNGWEFLEKYRELPEEQRAKAVVVMLTTSLNPSDEEKARSIPEISDFLNKPLTKHQLQKLIDAQKEPGE